jgi:hypothetical protein
MMEAAMRKDQEGKVYPPDSTVDVPNRPPRPKPGADDEAASQVQPTEEDRDDSSWADNTRPAPNKRGVRNSNFF